MVNFQKEILLKSIKRPKASNGWLDRFKKRHELLFKTISGEKNSSDLSTVSNFFADYDNCLETVGSENIFNCDETALYIKRTPSKSFVQFNDKCNGIKMSKEKVTLLLCCNALGEKLKPLLIGKFKSPRCLKNFNAEDHGVLYAASKNSWMTSDIFGKWLWKVNQDMINEKRKIVLILDNASCHRNTEYSNVYLLFLPKNTTALIQPLDMGIIKSFKSLYFNKLIDFTLIFEKEQLSDLNLNNVNLRQVITVVGEAWKMMSETTIINCWQKINENRSKISDNVQLDEELIDDVISDVISMDSTDITVRPRFGAAFLS
ncbi:tigger transposable element-derived protein 6-like [Octopus sinensis]|uniref:Tigger transposable element-derived protein 6-like n=1 Tax=Octopus sinensis TaxID=2607531 RepID=A0A6P7U1L6_9MOLL|nr:tigger transposable element-derived protein 6-like [Octopus sinensis]